MDEILKNMHEIAQKEGKVLRYVCSLENGNACAKVVAVAKAFKLDKARDYYVPNADSEYYLHSVKTTKNHPCLRYLVLFEDKQY